MQHSKPRSPAMLDRSCLEEATAPPTEGVVLTDFEGVIRYVNPACASPASAGASTTLRVPLAEDNPVNRRVATLLVEKQGHSVTKAHDGAAALTALAGQDFDVIALDVQMPGIDGMQATALIRALDAVIGGHSPIIALTAHAMAGGRTRFLEGGMDGYFAKPLRSRELFDTIADLQSCCNTQYEPERDHVATA